MLINDNAMLSMLINHCLTPVWT